MCLALARQAEGRTSPNPMVGSVVLDAQGAIAGRGYHHKAGEPHAEVLALREAGDQAKGGTIYISLEPCNHFGKTPPCVDAVKAAGITRVVAGIGDPNPLAVGGAQALATTGMAVSVGVLAEECAWLNRGFFKRVRSGLPWLCLKLATTLDGRIADRFGTSRWITGEKSRAYVHHLRNTFDCVLIGKETAAKDNPALNVRDIKNSRDPLRAVIDSRLSLDRSLRIFQADTGGNTIIFCNEIAPAHNPPIAKSNVDFINVKQLAPNRLDLDAALRALAARGVNTVLCEGGGTLAASLLEHNLVDEVCWIIAPKILIDANAFPSINGGSSIKLDQAIKLDKIRHEKLGNDILINGEVVYSDKTPYERLMASGFKPVDYPGPPDLASDTAERRRRFREQAERDNR